MSAGWAHSKLPISFLNALQGKEGDVEVAIQLFDDGTPATVKQLVKAMVGQSCRRTGWSCAPHRTCLSSFQH